MFIIGASSFNNILKAKSIPHSFRISLSRSSFALPGLSFNPSSNYRFKVLQNLLRRGPLARKRNIILWHDVISNSISKHQSNKYTTLSNEDLIKILLEFRFRIHAIVYVQRKGNPNILKELFATGILILDAKNKLLSQRKRRTLSVIRSLESVHPPLALEAHLLRIVVKHQHNLVSLLKKRRKNRRDRLLPERVITICRWRLFNPCDTHSAFTRTGRSGCF